MQVKVCKKFKAELTKINKARAGLRKKDRKVRKALRKAFGAKYKLIAKGLRGLKRK